MTKSNSTDPQSELMTWIHELEEAAKAGDREQVMVARGEVARLNMEANRADLKAAGITRPGEVPGNDRGAVTAGWLGALQGIGGAAGGGLGVAAGAPLGPFGMALGGLTGAALGSMAVKPAAQAMAGAVPGGVSAEDVKTQWDSTAAAHPLVTAASQVGGGMAAGAAARLLVGARTALANASIKQSQSILQKAAADKVLAKASSKIPLPPTRGSSAAAQIAGQHSAAEAHIIAALMKTGMTQKEAEAAVAALKGVGQAP